MPGPDQGLMIWLYGYSADEAICIDAAEFRSADIPRPKADIIVLIFLIYFLSISFFPFFFPFSFPVENIKDIKFSICLLLHPPITLTTKATHPDLKLRCWSPLSWSFSRPSPLLYSLETPQPTVCSDYDGFSVVELQGHLLAPLQYATIRPQQLRRYLVRLLLETKLGPTCGRRSISWAMEVYVSTFPRIHFKIISC